MSEIKYLLKFGRKAHIKEFVEGSLFCSNAETFWGIEENLKIKGQGDILEAGSRMFAQKLAIQAHGTNETTIINMNANVLVHFEPAKKIPVFCLFAVYDDDCVLTESGDTVISLSEETQKTIREHFPNADSVAIISNPEQFLEDVCTSIGTRVEHEAVHYFHIDKGLEVDGGKQTAMDMEYMKYLMQDVPPVKENGKKKYVFRAEYVYRSLFCKDVYFEDEQEYRIVLPDDEITEGTHYPVKLSEDIKVVAIEDLLN